MTDVTDRQTDGRTDAHLGVGVEILSSQRDVVVGVGREYSEMLDGETLNALLSLVQCLVRAGNSTFAVF